MKHPHVMIDTDQCVTNIGNRFDLILVASLRARELSRKTHTAKVVTRSNPIVATLQEIEAGHLGREYLNKVK